MLSIFIACFIAGLDSWVAKSAVSHYQQAFPHLDLRRSAAPLLALRGGGDVGGGDMRATRGRYTRGRGRGRQAGSRGVRGFRGGIHRPIGDIGPARDIRRGGEDSVLYIFLGKETYIKCKVIHKNAHRNTRTCECCVCVCVCVCARARAFACVDAPAYFISGCVSVCNVRTKLSFETPFFVFLVCTHQNTACT